MDDLSGVDGDSKEILDLMNAAATMQDRRTFDGLQQLADIGDQIAAREMTRLTVTSQSIADQIRSDPPL